MSKEIKKGKNLLGVKYETKASQIVKNHDYCQAQNDCWEFLSK